MKLLDVIADSEVVMLVLREKLIAPLGLMAPPSYAPEKGDKKKTPQFVEWEVAETGNSNNGNSRLNVLIDSIQSQANRIEPIFANYPELVPDIKVVYPDRTVGLVDVPHRAADATVKYHFEEELADLHKGNMVPLAKRNGTGLLFGVYDSRGTMERLDRMITGVVVARGVHRIPKAATKTELLSPEDRAKILGRDTLSKGDRDALSEYGVGEVPSFRKAGMLDAEDAEIERRVVFDLSLLDRLADLKVRDYEKGLGLVALLHPINMRLRSGTSLVVESRSLKAFKHCAEPIEIELDKALDDALTFARKAATDFGIAKAETLKVDLAKVKKGLDGWRERKKKGIMEAVEVEEVEEKPVAAKARGAK